MKTTSKTIVNLIAAVSLLFAASYQIWSQSAVSASSVKQTPAKSKSLTQTPTAPAPTDTLPSTPASPGGSGGTTTTPSAPVAPEGGSGTGTTPEAPATNNPSSSDPAPAATGKTIVDVATGNKQLKTLTSAIKAAGLEETLAGKGPFTVFAPTDKAFAALPPGTVDELLKPENKDKLTQLLTYHVVSGKLESTDLKSGDVSSVLGKPISVTVKDKKVTVNEANVVKADVPASNGVIHLIDKVILPSG